MCRNIVKFALLLSLIVSASAAFAAEGKLTGVEQLAGEHLAAQRGTVGQFLAEDIINGHEGSLTTFERYADAVAALRLRKVRAVVMDEAPALRFVRDVGDVVIMDEPMSVESYAIGFKKGNTELVAKVNAALAEMKADGTLAAVIEKYHENPTGTDPSEIDLNAGAKGGELIVGTEAGFAPYELKIGSGYIGIDIEMCAYIAKKLDMALVIRDMNFDSLPTAVSTGKVDMICAGITVTDERKQNMDFSDNYIENARQIALVRADDYEPSK